MEHAKPEPGEVVPEIPSVEGSQAAATRKAAQPRPTRGAGMLQEELDRYLADCAFGGLPSVFGFRDLLEFPLRLTVMRPSTPRPCLAINFDRDSNPTGIKGRVPLNDGDFLVVEYDVTAPEPKRLTVRHAKVQYGKGPGQRQCSGSGAMTTTGPETVGGRTTT